MNQQHLAYNATQEDIEELKQKDKAEKAARLKV